MTRKKNFYISGFAPFWPLSIKVLLRDIFYDIILETGANGWKVYELKLFFSIRGPYDTFYGILLGIGA